jgi:tetratricopeptide (TPR) repeat protein
MTGVLGLLVYIALYMVLIQKIRARGRVNLWEGVALLTWMTAYFVQNLTGFDTVVTFFTFFVLLAYCISDETAKAEILPLKKKPTTDVLVPPLGLPIVAMAATLLGAWIFFVGTVMPYFQMFAYRSAIEYSPSIHDASLLGAFPFKYDTYVRGLICNDLVNTVFKAYNDGYIKKPNPFLDRAIAEMESYIQKHPDLYDDHLILAKSYDMQGAVHEYENKYFKMAEREYLAALKLMPDRQTILYPYAINLAQQDRMPEAISMLQQAYQKNPDIHTTGYILAEVYAMGGEKYDMEALDAFESSFGRGINMNPNFTIKAYQGLLKDFYEAGDVEHFTVALERLVSIADKEKSSYAAILKETKETGVIPSVDFSGF